MDHGAHGSIEDKYTLFQDIFERLLTLQGFGHSGCAFFSLAGQPHRPKELALATY